MKKQIFEVWEILKDLSQRSVLEHAWEFVPVSDRMHALFGKIVSIVAGFSCAVCPFLQLGLFALANLLLLLIEDLVRSLLPMKDQIADRRDGS